MSIRITTISENTAIMGDFLAEWGLSTLIETDEAKILLDTGRSISTCHNADELGIDLSQVDHIVLSHGHSDHTGGLRAVLSRMKKEVPTTAHPDIWGAKYVQREEEQEKYIGIPFQRRELESLGASFILTKEPARLTRNITTTGEIPMATSFEEVDTALFVKENGGLQPDTLTDDLALVINTEAGLVVVLGCAHRGMVNTLYHAQQLTSVAAIHAVIGGAHLSGTSEEQVWSTIAALKDLGVQKLGLCHCTGMAAIMVLAHEFGDQFFFNNSGTSIELP